MTTTTLPFTRPVRGAVRLDALSWDIEPLLQEISQIQGSDWNPLNYGTHWSEVTLYSKGAGGAEQSHPMMDACPELNKVLNGFPANALDLCVALLDPGGDVKEHRDISGGVAAGVTRLHIPVQTNKDVVFHISGKPVRMGAGEVWNLDTTYLHRVANHSEESRIHVIIDLETTDELQAMLPRPDLRDRLHNVYFFCVCGVKGLTLLVRDPRQLYSRTRDFVRLRFMRESVLHGSEDRNR